MIKSETVKIEIDGETLNVTVKEWMPTGPGKKRASRDELTAAFEKVENAEHWKDPIDCEISRDDLEIVSEAVLYFTATQVEVIEELGDRVRIKAAGYRAGPAN